METILSQPKGSVELPTALLQEVFSSYQGEGPYVGVRQIFVRGSHCHLHCAYCDTTMHKPDHRCHVEWEPGSGQMRIFENPMTPEQLVQILSHLRQQTPTHSVSFTGGEPLLYHKFLAQVFPEVQAMGLKTYLETSGTQPEFLKAVLPWTDIIAMDIKLPSSTRESVELWESHRGFFRLAQSRPEAELFIKLIVNGETTETELDHVHEIVTDLTVPIMVQPETRLDDSTRVNITPPQLMALETHLSRLGHPVRIIPQTHKMLRVL